MAVYNDSFMNNATDIVKVFEGIGSATGQPFLFGYLIMVVFFLAFLILAMKNSFIETLLIDAFLTTVIGVLLSFAGLVPGVAIAYPFVIFVFVLIFYLFA